VQEAERMRVYDQIDELLVKCRKCPKHNPRGYYLHECRGCPILDELQALGEQLHQKKPRKQEERIRSILEKGQDMTTSEVHYLIKSGVPKKKISQALDMHQQTFDRLLEKMKRGWRHETSKAF
jgi:DNA replication protein DnaC